MILVTVQLVTNPILVSVSLKQRVGAVVTGIRDTIFNNTTTIVKDIVIP
jgi:hypothetical protein